jgi:hypothetical protein
MRERQGVQEMQELKRARALTERKQRVHDIIHIHQTYDPEVHDINQSRKKELLIQKFLEKPLGDKFRNSNEVRDRNHGRNLSMHRQINSDL